MSIFVDIYSMEIDFFFRKKKMLWELKFKSKRKESKEREGGKSKDKKRILLN